MFASVPPFSLTKPRYDMDSYLGRCAYFFSAIDPRLCLENEPSLRAHQARLAAFRAAAGGGKPSTVSDAELWESRRAVEACVHPTTNAVLPPLFRMAAFMPANLFIVPVMMLPSTIVSPVRTVGIHVLNQSYNCAINYANRASDEQPISTLLQAYAAAVTVSVSGALAATAVLKRLGTQPSAAATLTRAILPAFAVAFAGSANLAMMRRPEWQSEGVRVLDEDGREVGRSVAAGRKSLAMCAAARVLWNIPCMMLPPLLSAPLYRFAFFRSRQIMTETTLVIIGMVVGVAPALAWYPPNVKVAPSELEEKFHGLKRANGEPVKQLTFYKGL